MSGGSHWRAEDYEWDPHNLQSKRTAEQQAPHPSGAASVSTGEAEEQGDLPSFKEQPKASDVDTSPAVGSGDDTSHMQTSGGDPSRGFQSAVTQSVAGTQDDSADAPTSARRHVPVLKDGFSNSRGGQKKKVPMQCQVDGCQKDLSKEKEYYQRYRICEFHLKLSSLIKEGVPQRFCQQCGRFHILADFDSDKRSCRARLDLHNNRRRKRMPNAQETPRQELSGPQLRSRRTRTRRKSKIYIDDSDPTDSGELQHKAEAKAESLPSRLSRSDANSGECSVNPALTFPVRRVDAAVKGHQESAERPLLHQEMEQGQKLEPPMFAMQQAAYPSLTFPDNQQVHYPPEVNASLAGFANVLHGEGDMRRSFDSRSDIQSTELLGSYHPQSVSNLESESPMSMHLASQLGMEIERQRASLPIKWPDAGPLESQEHRPPSLPSKRHYLLESTESSIAGVPTVPPQLRTVPAQDYLYGEPNPHPSWHGSEGNTSSMMSHKDVARHSTGPSHGPSRNEMPSMPSIQYIPGFNLRFSSGNPSTGPNAARRLEPGTSRLAGYQPQQQRLTVSAPEQMAIPDHAQQAADFLPYTGPGFPLINHTRHSDPGIMGTPYFADPDPSGGHRPARWSDPGSWTPHYPGMYGDARLLSSQGSAGSSLESQRTRLMRSAMKMDIPPDRLPADMRDTYLQMTNASPSGHMEAALRPGCTHLVAVCLVQGLQPNALEGIARLMDFNDSIWSSKEVLVQHIDSTAQMRAGRVTGFWAEQNHKNLQPPKPYTSAVAINPGAEVLVSFQPEQLGNMPDRILARCNGYFLHDQQAQPGAREAGVKLPEGEWNGVLWLETERQGLLSEATAVVLCQDLDVVADVQSMDNSILLRQMPRDEVESLLVDIGMVLQYAAFKEKQSNLPTEQGPSTPQPFCCRVARPSSEEQTEQGRMSGALYLRYITAAARRVLAICCREGWPHLAAKVMPVAAIGLVTWLEIVSSVEAYLGQDLLLHAIVSSASMAMLLLILDLYDLFKETIKLSGKWKGATALHLAAAMPDNSATAKLILDRCPAAKSMWNSSRNAQGQSPADVAYMAYERLTRSQKVSEAAIQKLCEQTETLNSPPPTPRVTPDGPRSSRKLVAPSDLPPLSKAHWLNFQSPGKTKSSRTDSGGRRRSGDGRAGTEGGSSGSKQGSPSIVDTAMEDLHEIASDGHATVSSPNSRQRHGERKHSSGGEGTKRGTTSSSPPSADRPRKSPGA